jgi:uncharacterized protein (DUF849 family)
MSRRDFLAVAGAGVVAVKSGTLGAADQSRLPLLKSTINGGRQRGSHPALPTTPAECARTARGVVDAGAGAIHVHVRGPDGAESITPADLARTLGAMRNEVSDTPIGVSTHFRILGDVARRRETVAAWTELPDFASVNFHEDGAVELAQQLMDRGVGVEAGLFQADAARVCVQSGMAPRCLRLMLEPGAGTLEDVLRNVSEMETVLNAVDIEGPRLLHGSRGVSWSLVDEATRRGYQTRVGFEDSFEMPDGRTARDNGEMVVEAARRIGAIVGAP